MRHFICVVLFCLIASTNVAAPPAISFDQGVAISFPVNAASNNSGTAINGVLTRDVKLGEPLAAGDIVDVIGSIYGDQYKKNENPSPELPLSSAGESVAMSADGGILALAHQGSTAPARLITYKWSEGNSRYEKTDNPDVAPSASSLSVAISADGLFLAVGHIGSAAPAYLITYKWSESNNRYEKTDNPDVAPSGLGSGVALSPDGQWLSVAHAGSTAPAYLITYKWNEDNNRYEKTDNPDVAPSGSGYGVALSSDGQRLSVAHAGSTAPAYLITYKWNESNNRYEKTNNPDAAPSGSGSGATLSSDGQRLAVTHAGSTAPARLITYKWNEDNNRYEKTNNPDAAPSGSTRGTEMCADGTYLAVAHAGTSAPARLAVYKWSEGGNRYELMGVNPDIVPSSDGRDIAISSDGQRLAVAHYGTVAPAQLITYSLDPERHTLKAFKSINARFMPHVYYTGVLTTAGSANQVVSAKMIMWPQAPNRDWLEEFGANPE